MQENTSDETFLLKQKEQLTQDISMLKIQFNYNHKKWISYYFLTVLTILTLCFILDMYYVYKNGWSSYTFISFGFFFFTIILEKFNLHEKTVGYFNKKTKIAKKLNIKEHLLNL